MEGVLLPVSERTPLRGEASTPSSARVFWLLPAALTTISLVWGCSTVGSYRILYHWPLTITAVFASLVAGATPEGGSSVFFPVLTLVVGAPPATARSFGLGVQAIGMSVASLRIFVTQTRVDWTVLAVVFPPAVATEVYALLFLVDASDPELAALRPPVVSPPTVQVIFVVMLASMAFVSALMLCTADHSALHPRVMPWNVRRTVALFLAGAAGGALSAISASGANLLTYLLTVACFDVSPKVAVPTTVLLTAALSLVGLVVLGTAGQQLDALINETSHEVVQVGDTPLVPPCLESQCDLLGLLAAAAPVVVWGAPTGAELDGSGGGGMLASYVRGGRVRGPVAALAVGRRLAR